MLMSLPSTYHPGGPELPAWIRGLVPSRGLRVGPWSPDGRGILLALALAVGAGAGLGAVAFRWLITGATQLFAGTQDYAGTHGHPAHPGLVWLGPWFIVLAPAIGGLLYGPLVSRFAREARGHGVPEVMYAVAQRGGRIAGRVAVVKALASALCIGSGGSVGREGPIVQIGSALGSWIGRFARVPEARLRTLVACGSAAGIAATFNAPIAGVMFALELLLRDFAAEAFGIVVLSAVTASVVGRAVFGNTPFLHLPPFSLVSPVEYGLYAGLGLVAGLVGILFTRILYAVEDVCDWAWRGPEWARPAAGGLLLGLVLLVLPQLYGVGYPVLQSGVEGRYALGFLLVLMLGKMVATSLTIGIGGSGGVFAPSLFIGAMLGAAFGGIAHAVIPAMTGPIGAYALVGMGAVFAGAARAPITAVLIMFELTGEYAIILPLMLAIVVASGISHWLSRDTVYTLKLRRRGVDLQTHAGDWRLRTVRVEDVMLALPPALPADLALPQAARALLTGEHPVLPVIDRSRLLGVVSARAVSEALANDTETKGITVGHLAELPPAVTTGTMLADALESLVTSDATGVPVVDADRQLLGWLTHQAVLRAVLPGPLARAQPHPRRM
jgi:CIC family chloride channel protein